MFKWYRNHKDRKQGYFINVNKSHFLKNCLLVYITAPFTSKNLQFNHQNQLQTIELARLLGEFGYNVDVVDLGNNHVKLNKAYDLIVDIHPGETTIYQDHLSTNGKKIAYITGSNPVFSNAQEIKRLQDLSARRGKTLMQRRYVPPFDKERLESFDSIFLLGNEQTLSTYSNFNLKRTYLLPNTGHESLYSYNFSGKLSDHFLFLGSIGQVHKGLDLLLDIFSETKDKYLYILSAFKDEEDFCDLYFDELFHTPNIHPIGWADFWDENVKKILHTCSYLLMPSCSEGMAGSVLSAMSAGVIPIISKECGIDFPNCILLKNCSLQTIKESVEAYSNRSGEWIKEHCAYSVNIVKSHYSIANYKERVRTALRGTLED